jgi:c(7)-type cytochrome triheme protein
VKRIFLPLFIFGILLFSGLALGRIGGGDVAFKPQKTKPVTFSHDFHVKDLGLTCHKCHPSLYVTREKDKSVTMAAMAQGKSCGSCHNGKEAFPVSAKDKCSRCHQ